MKILYLSTTGTLGGAEKVLLGIMAALRHARPDLQLHLLALAPGPLVEHAAHLGVDAGVLPLPAELESLGDSQFAGGARSRKIAALVRQVFGAGLLAASFLRRFRRRIRQVNPDLIHSNGIKTHLLSWLARPGPTPVLWHVHDFLAARPVARPLLHRALRRIAGAVAVSTAVAADLRCLGTNSVWVIPNALDVNEYSPGAGDDGILDRLAGLDPKPCLRVGLIATYARWKGHRIFLDAIARLKKLAPSLPVRFYIVGGPIYQTRGSQFDVAELHQLAREFDVDDRVGFVAFQKDIVPIYRSLDLVVHASTAPEPFGLTIIEAMACGKTVIASLAGGVVDIIRPGVDALGVPPDDPQALADAMQFALTNTAKRAALGARARMTACDRFNRERIGGEVLAVYRQLLRPTGQRTSNRTTLSDARKKTSRFGLWDRSPILSFSDRIGILSHKSGNLFFEQR